MSKILDVFLGVLTAMGGFVEVGELTFALNGGVQFGYALLWVLLVATLGIVVYCEMAGRVAAVRGQPVFSIIRERVGFNAGLVTLVAANLVSLLTCAAEIGAIAQLWQLLSGWPYRGLAAGVFVLLVVTVWLLKFEWIERVFGLGGLMMIVFLVVAWKAGPDWAAMAEGLVPRLTSPSSASTLLYWYFAVALFSSVMLPYETYFYAAGAIEDRWKPEDLKLNRVIAIVGMTLGAFLVVALVAIGAEFFSPRDVQPQLPGLAAVSAAMAYGKAGLLVALGGMFFAFAGAAIETSLSAAYNLAHFLGWPWGKAQRPRRAPRFTLAWIAVFVLAAIVIESGVDPVTVVEYSIVFSVVVLPFSYFPLLTVAADRRVMGEHANGRLANALGWLYLAAVTLAALAAIPLFILTHGGRG